MIALLQRNKHDINATNCSPIGPRSRASFSKPLPHPFPQKSSANR